jgi:hypothetical protein
VSRKQSGRSRQIGGQRGSIPMTNSLHRKSNSSYTTGLLYGLRPLLKLGPTLSM